MGYRYFNVWSGRKVFTALFVLFILPAVFGNCGKVLGRRFSSVNNGVYVAGKHLGGMAESEARTALTHLAEELLVEPVDAVIDPETKGVIPELDGRALDVETTLAVVMKAKSGESVTPVFTRKAAAVTMADFPAAPVYRGNPAKSQVAFLVNVAWGNEFLEEMLDVLRENKAGATFFLVGRWVRQNEAMAKAIVDGGFEVASHGDSDAVSMGKLGLLEAAEQIRLAAETIERVCGVRPVYFSPHRGELSEHVLKAAVEEKSRVIMWTVDTVDWKLPGVDVMKEKILNQAKGGSLILMHPTKQTAEFLRHVIPGLRSRGLEPVSLSVLLSPSGCEKEVIHP